MVVPYYGDISGDFRGLLNGNSDFCVVAVVGGSTNACMRCPKRTVRRIENVDEAHWSDLEDVEKRRFVDCVTDNCSDLKIGFAVITERDIQRLPCSYRIYQGTVSPEWDIALRAFSYSEIIFNWQDQHDRIEFYPDRFAAPAQRQQLVDFTTKILPQSTVETSSSKHRKGVQLADCVAGAIREERLDRHPWGGTIKDVCDGSDRGDEALVQLEHWLDES